MNLFKIDIIIVTYNGMQWIERCLRSVLNSSVFGSVIVVDNYSEDGTVDYIKANFPEVILLEQNENLGFGKANNIGIKRAYESGAYYFFLLNQDVYVERGTIEELINAHQKEPQYGIVSPVHLNGNGDALDFNFSKFISPARCGKLYSDMFLNKVQNRIYETEFVNAAGWLLSKKCIETVGGFNPSFFHYAEDDNYVQRTRFHQLKIGVLPNAIIYHDREDRSENVFFKNKEITYKREIVFKISNPHQDNSFQAEYVKLYKAILLSILFLRKRQFMETCSRFMVLIQLDKKQIIKNRNLSKINQSSFLQ